MKTCKMGCGKMKSGGAATKPIKKMKSGGAATLKDIINKNGVAMSGTTGPMMMKKGGSSSLPICKGGNVRMPDGSCGDRKFKSGGAIKKFAALAPPYDKATAADRIAGAKKNARKKK
jgi:hypothetical protein